MTKNFKKLPDFLKEDAKKCPVWNHFNIVRQIPRPSKKEDKIREYIISVAKKQGYKYKVDNIGNLIVFIPKTQENKSNNVNNTVCLQSHLDMVCEKDSHKEFDFEKDSIELQEENGFITASGTTLGADNGIGVSYMLELMTNREILHPDLELLFTVDEEQGMSGAINFEKEELNAKYLINLDSEEDWQITIGSAGGVEINAEYTIKKEVINANANCFRLLVKGLEGGHSGCDIHKYKIGNAISIGSLILKELLENVDEFNLLTINAGTANNAIPREFDVEFATTKNLKQLQNISKKLVDALKKIYRNLEVSFEIIAKQAKIISSEDTKNIVNLLSSIHSGIYTQSESVLGLTQTSNNLGIVRTEEEKVFVANMARSFDDDELYEIYVKIRNQLKTHKFEIKETNWISSWSPEPDCELVKIAEKTYKELFRKEVEIMAIHAGLECGVLKKNYNKMQIISIGPNIFGPHSPKERVEIESVQKVWEYLLILLEKLG